MVEANPKTNPADAVLQPIISVMMVIETIAIIERLKPSTTTAP